MGRVAPKASLFPDVSPPSLPSFCLHLSSPSRQVDLWSLHWCHLLLKFFWHGYLYVSLFFFPFKFPFKFLFCYFFLIQFCLAMWLFACWTAFCWKDSDEAAFFRLTEEEKKHILWDYLFSFFSNEWIHRMDTRLLRSDEGWTGGICGTYLNAENSPEK